MRLNSSNEIMDDELLDENDLPQDEDDMDDETLTLEIRSFNTLKLKKDTKEYMKPFSFEMFVRDSDDVC